MICQPNNNYPCAIPVYICVLVLFNYLIMNDNITVSSWNIKGLSGSLPRIVELLSKCDICILLEHHQPENQLQRLEEISPTHDVYARSSRSLDASKQTCPIGYGGLAIIWHNQLSHCVKPLKHIGNDRVMAVELCPENRRSVYIIAVYLPHRTCTIDNFDESVDVLDTVITACVANGDVIVIGDYNCHYGPEYGPRCWGETTRNASYLYRVLSRHNCTLVDTGTTCEGPNYTFHVDGVGTSYIDHCAVTYGLVDSVTEVCVLPDDIHNTSDHLPLLMRFQCNLKSPSKAYKPRVCRYAWDRLTTEAANEYRQDVANKASQLMEQYGLDGEGCIVPQKIIDQYTRDIIECMKSASDCCVPKLRRDGKGKPYWSSRLTKLNKEQKRARDQWIANGRPQQPDDPSKVSYKEAKRIFRATQRKLEYEYEQHMMEDIASSSMIDQKLFWHLIHKRTGKKKAVTCQTTTDESSGQKLCKEAS